MFVAFDEGEQCGKFSGLGLVHTSARTTGRVEVVGRMSGRRSWSDEEKLQILAEAFRLGVRVRDVLQRRELSSGLVYRFVKR